DTASITIRHERWFHLCSAGGNGTSSNATGRMGGRTGRTESVGSSLRLNPLFARAVYRPSLPLAFGHCHASWVRLPPRPSRPGSLGRRPSLVQQEVPISTADLRARCV